MRSVKDLINTSYNIGESSMEKITQFKSREFANLMANKKLDEALDMEPKEIYGYSILRALKAASSRNWDTAGLEYAAHRAIADKTGRSPKSEGSFFVPREILMRGLDAAATGAPLVPAVQGSFIELLRAQSVVLSMGATTMQVTGNVTVPRQTGAATAQWLADEQDPIVPSQQAFGQITMTPKNCAALTQVSHQLLAQSSPSVETVILTDLAAVIAAAVDSAVINGTGLNGQPLGILNTGGIGAFTVNPATSYADVLAAQEDLYSANALNTACAYLAGGNAAVKLASRSRFANTDTPLWSGSLAAGTVAGFPAVISNNLASDSLLFGRWDTVLIAEWGSLELQTNPYQDFTRGLVGIRAWYAMDVAIKYPASFTYCATVN